MKSIFGGLVGIGVLALGVHSAGAASLVANGSFEKGVDPGSSFITVSGGDSTSITDWTVGGDSVDYIGGYWQPSDGSRSIDMSGNGPGTLSQNLATVAGTTYRVTFDLAGNPDYMTNPNRTLGLNVGVGSQTFNFSVAGKTKTDMGWTSESFTFKAVGATTLTFSDMSNTGPYGAALDNVSVVSAVPLPASAPMFGAALAALGLVGFGLKRKVKAAV